MKTRNRLRTAARRKAVFGEPHVVVVEEPGQLVAIVEDEVRGVTRIPIGTVDPQRPFFP